MSFNRLAQALAKPSQPHAVKGGKARIAAHPPITPARRMSPATKRKLMRPGNNMGAPRQFVENNRRPPLSIKG